MILSTRHMLAAGLSVCLVPEAWAACQSLDYRMGEDAPVVQGANCAFTGAGSNDVRGFYRGQPARDAGAGLVTQVLAEQDSKCGSTQALLVVDCKADEFTVFHGTRRPANDPDWDRGMPGPASGQVENILAPLGPLVLDASADLAALETAAKAALVGFHSRVEAMFRQTYWQDDRNRYDLKCGCKAFYPASIGAQG